jgi:hypothetical protein
MASPFGAPEETEEDDLMALDELEEELAEEPEGSDLEDEPLEMDEREIIQLLGRYFDEAENSRETGFEPRHEVWERNLHAFWMRRDFSDKMPWQSREQSTMVPNFVERFAASQRQALSQSPNWAEIIDRDDPTQQLSRFATDFIRLCLDFCGTNDSGQTVPFEAIFGGLVQAGALTEMMAAVTWDAKEGRVRVTPVDPRQCYRDPTGRGLYRVRFWEVDKETLLRMADEEVDEDGEPIWDREAIEELVAHHDQDLVQDLQVSSGAGQDLPSPRTPILLKEWLVDLIDTRGKAGKHRKVREKQLIVTANDDRIVRGPEPNPYWHGKDWIVAHPILAAPLQQGDGRTYVELFRQDVETYENVMNRIYDAVATNSLNAFEVNPDCLDDPTLLESGIAPNQTVFRSDMAPPGERAITPIEMGRPLTSDIVRLASEAKRNAQESGAQSDIALGQTAKGETTATEASLSSEGQNALTGAVSMDIDLNFLGPLVELMYYTGLQHVDEDQGSRALGSGVWYALTEPQRAMLKSRREEFRARPVAVRAKGLTKAVERRNRLRGVLGALNVVGGNPLLADAFVKKYSLDALIALILEDFGVPVTRIELTEEERFMQDEKRREEEAKRKAAEAMGGPAVGGMDGSAPPQTSQNQGGPDPLMPGSVGGLSGGPM